MSRTWIVLLLLLTSSSVMGQTQSTNVTISYTKTNVREVIKSLEEKTQLKFYYVDTWLSNDSISGNFTDTPIDDILDALFRNTIINFYVIDGEKVILTQHNVIYDRLPNGFFEKSDEEVLQVAASEETTAVLNPVFHSEQHEPLQGPLETVRIGKETLAGQKKRYTLSGYVRNLKTDQPIADLALLVRNRKIGTVTDDNGFYEIALPAGENLFETRALGIETQLKMVIIYNDGTLDFNLNEKFEQLDEVVVGADKAKNVEEEMTGATTIESEETKDIPMVLGERNILSVATTLPGITNAGEGASGLNVRGGKTDQNLFLLDEGVVYNPTHFFGIFQALNPFTTKGVEIYKGNVPAAFGGRLSSVFDITTIDGNAKVFSGEASIGPVTGNLMLEIPVIIDKSSLVVGGRGAYSDWILKALDETSLKHSTASFHDVLANYSHKINENNQVKATAYYSKDAFSITSDSLYRYSNRLFSLVWRHKFNERNNGSVVFSNSTYAFDIDFKGQANNDFLLGYSVEETEAKLKFKFIMNDSHTLDYGFAGKRYRINPGFIRPTGNESIINPFEVPEDRAFEGAIYVSDAFDLGKKLA